MTSFATNSFETASRSLANGETGFIGPAGVIATATGIPLYTSGNSALTVLGALYSGLAGGYGVNGSNTGFRLNVGASGSVTSMYLSIFEQFSSYFMVDNAGSLSGGWIGILAYGLQPDTSSVINNSGTITGALVPALSSSFSTSAPAAGIYYWGQPGTVSISNSGLIAGTSGIYVDTAWTVTITNSGLIETLTPGQTINGHGSYAIKLSDGVATIINSGTVHGAVVTGSAADSVSNSGTMGDVVLSGGANSFGQSAGSAHWLTFGNAADQVTIAGGVTGTIWVYGGDDTVINSGRVGVVYLGQGNDTYFGADGASGAIWGGAGNDSITGGAGHDSLSGQDGNDWLAGGAGDDWIDTGNGNDTAFGGGGDDTIWGWLGNDALNGGTGDDRIDGGGGNDLITGGAGGDSLIGGDNADTLLGQTGDDTLLGGTGNDRLEGGRGNDMLTGGANADIFVFAPGGDYDVITDFQDGVDKIDISALGLTSYNADVQPLAAQHSGGVLIDLSAEYGLEIFVAGVKLAQLGTADFVV